VNNDKMLSQRNVYTRLALEKILNSKCLGYLEAEELSKLNSSFLSPFPGEHNHVFKLEVRKQEKHGYFRGVVAVVSLAWMLVKERELDKLGNFWSVYEFIPTVSIKERYSLSGEILSDWMDCVSSIVQLLDDIKSLNIPVRIKEMTHTNEQRMKFESQKSYEDTCNSLSKYFQTSEGKKLRLNLRKGGKSRKIPFAILQQFLKAGPEKVYVFNVRENYSYFSKYRKYSITVENNFDYVLIKREP